MRCRACDRIMFFNWGDGLCPDCGNAEASKEARHA